MTGLLNDDGWTAWVREYQEVFWWLGALSIATLIVSALVMPVLLARIPPDYFVPEHRHLHIRESPHPVLRALELTLKNLLGVILLASGLAMLVLPGQGILTILIGLGVMDFPGKYRMERWIIGRSAVLKAVNWIRKKSHHPPLVMTKVEFDANAQSPASSEHDA